MSGKNVKTTMQEKDPFKSYSRELKILWTGCAAIVALGVIDAIKTAQTPKEIHITDNLRGIAVDTLAPPRLTQ